MTLETARHALTAAASAYLSQPVDHCATLPWPFADDLGAFRYSVNVDPAMVPRPTAAGEWGRTIVDLGGSVTRRSWRIGGGSSTRTRTG